MYNPPIRKIIITIAGIFGLLVIIWVGTVVYDQFLKQTPLSVHTFPGDAAITINGKDKNLKDGVIALSNGKHTIKFTAPGYKERTKTVTISKKNEIPELWIALIPEQPRDYKKYNNKDAKKVLYHDDISQGGIYTQIPFSIGGNKGFGLSKCEPVRSTSPSLCFESSSGVSTNMIDKSMKAPFPIELYEIYPIKKHGVVIYEDADMEAIFVGFSEEATGQEDGRSTILIYTDLTKDAAVVRLEEHGIETNKFDILIRNSSSTDEESDIYG